MRPPLIYNLFPRLVGPAPRWLEHSRRARRMRFDWIYLNPWHYPGFSGSLYAPKEFRRMNPLFLPEGAPQDSLEPLRDYLHGARDAGLRVMMDLVVNHTSKDAVLTEQHPEWYVRDQSGALVSPFVLDPDDPSKKTVWGDLAEIDNEGAENRDALWAYWADLVRDSLELGFSGFRCDAAYKVPAELWRHLIAAAKEVKPDAEFFAETLGAPKKEVVALKEAGFDYFFNSSKYWDFREPWALKQHAEFGAIAPSIAFPESHDTTRLAADSGGDEAVQRQRYAFAAAFSAGLMMPIGYEFGFRKQVNVVETQPSDWEREHFDLSQFVTRVNRMKQEHAVLQGEGELSAPWGLDGEVLALERRSEAAGGARGWILVNKRADQEFDVSLRGSATEAAMEGGHRMFRVCRDHAPEDGEAVPEQIQMQRAEVIYVLP